MKIFCFILLIPSVAFGQFQNLDFEIWDPENQIFIGWNSRRGTQIECDSSHQVSGNYAIKLVTKQSSSSVSQGYDLPNTDLRRFTLSGKINTNLVEGGSAGLFATAVASDGLKFYNQILVGNSADWSTLELELITTRESEKIYIGAQFMGQGSVLFDQFEVREKLLTTEYSNTEAIRFVDEVGKLIQENSVVLDSIDLESILEDCKVLCSSDITASDTYPIIRYLIGKLADNHSRITTSEEKSNWKEMKVTSSSQPNGDIIDGIAYVEIPGFRTGDPEQMTMYADHLMSVLHELDLQNPVGWIIDLRGNTGGNFFAMMAGLSPIFGNKEYVKMTYRDGSIKSVLFNKRDLIYDEKKVAKTSSKSVPLSSAKGKIAVLLGPNTSSAGEMVAIAFKSLSTSRFFGQPTMGVASNTEEFSLSDGSVLYLATSYCTDVQGIVYVKGLTPDEHVEESLEFDHTLLMAKSWILEN